MTAIDMFPEAYVDPTVDLDQRYTLDETDHWIRRKCDIKEWDLDAAACDESHRARLYYTIRDNGLDKPWFGNVFVNPPYSDIEPWVQKAWIEIMIHDVKLIAMLLPANRTEQPWWQKNVEQQRDWERGPHTLYTRFLPGRTRFGHPGNPLGVGVGSPPFGCVLLVWRRHS